MKESLSRNKRYWELLWKALELNEEYEKFLKSDAPKAVDRFNLRIRNHRPGMKPLIQPKAYTKWGTWVSIYDRFGDVHREDFEKWWTRREKRIQASPSHYFQSCADYGDYWAGFDIDQAFANSGPVEDTKEFKARFRKFFVDRIQKGRLVHIVLDPEEDFAILDAEYRKIIERKRTRPVRGSGRPRLAEIESYLKLYKLQKKEGLDVEAIVEKEGSATQKEAAKKKTRAWYDIKKEYEDRIEKGITIVRNLKRCCFPAIEDPKGFCPYRKDFFL